MEIQGTQDGRQIEGGHRILHESNCYNQIDDPSGVKQTGSIRIHDRSRQQDRQQAQVVHKPEIKHQQGKNIENYEKLRNMGKEIIIRKGFVQAMGGKELWVNTQTDEIVKFVVMDDELREKLYCTFVKITIEQIDESEFDQK
jgi:hypothetical protein